VARLRCSGETVLAAVVGDQVDGQLCHCEDRSRLL
jgi:hypothetical protein